MDLSKLSRQEKLELLAALEEKEKRARSTGELFVPHPGQNKVIQSPALEKYLFPGNGYGKTALLVNVLHWAAHGHNPLTGTTAPVPAKICLVVATTKDIDEVLVEYQRWNRLKEDQLHKKGKPHVSHISYDNGSSVTILTHEVNPLSLEGSQWTHLFFNEPPPKAVFTALYRGGRIKGRPLQVLLAGTPIAASWLRTDIYEPWLEGKLPKVECFQGRTDENQDNLDEGYIDRFKAILSEKEALIRLEGQFFDMDGLALAHLWRDATHLVPRAELMEVWDERNPCVVAMDPHTSKAHHAVLLGVDRENKLYVLEEYSEKGLARSFARSLIERGWFARYRVTDIVYDSAGNAEMTSGEGLKPFGQVVNEVFREHGIGRARGTTYEEKDDEEWVESIRDLLALPEKADINGQRLPRLRVVSGCGGTVNDIKNVQWAQDKNRENKPKLDIGKKDFLSCVKYALACNPRHNKAEKTVYYRKDRAYGVSVKPSIRHMRIARR